ncbi:hypothetical protein BGZ98_008398 [Dissophora globulifera]|nr:hypothetical protein BGZ98_008398 [Dissophora globulifera]
MAILRRYGNHVVALDFVHADKKTFKFIRQFCSSLQSLSMVFDSDSSWINYDCLEKFFRRMSTLNTLQIRFDAFQFSPAMFWSLCQLPNLTSLTMDVFYMQPYGSKHYHPDIYMTILDCCPNLQELEVRGLFLEPADTAQFYHKNSFPQWIKKTFRPRRENPPSDTQEAMAPSRHSRSWSAGASIRHLGQKSERIAHSRSASEADTTIPASFASPSSHMGGYSIRKLDLRSPQMDDNVFCKLASRCTRLEELTLDGVWVRISAESWQTLSTQCLRLRSLTVRNSGAVHYLPSIQTLMALYLRLESVTMMSLEFNRDPDLSTLAAKTLALERQTRVVHPLKHIHLSGSILKPLKVLLDVVTQSSTIESLSVGFTLNAVRRLDNETNAPYDLSKRWLCQDTLSHLDLTSVSFTDKAVFSQFFGHVQRLTHLRSLWISVSHIREAWAITALNRGGLIGTRHSPSSSSGQGGSSPYNLPSASTPSLGVFSGRSNGSGNIHTSFFCFPALETLRIGMACYLNKKWFEMPVVFEEVVYMIEATPLLKRLELKHMSESGVIKRLSAEYPKISFT